MGKHLSIEGILPHRLPALLVTGVSDHSGDSLVCTGRIPSDHPSVLDGHAPVTMAVELAAQASGLLFAIRDAEGDGDEPVSREGYLVSLNDVDIRAVSVPAESTLDVQIRFRAGFGNLATFCFNVEFESESVAEGNLGIAIAGRGE